MCCIQIVKPSLNCDFRGVYLSALLYNEDKVLVTNEEVLPIIEVDENYSASSLHADFHWLIKVCREFALFYTKNLKILLRSFLQDALLAWTQKVQCPCFSLCPSQSLLSVDNRNKLIY